MVVECWVWVWVTLLSLLLAVAFEVEKFGLLHELWGCVEGG
jgi:hypothetical protein